MSAVKVKRVIPKSMRPLSSSQGAWNVITPEYTVGLWGVKSAADQQGGYLKNQGGHLSRYGAWIMLPVSYNDLPREESSALARRTGEWLRDNNLDRPFLTRRAAIQAIEAVVEMGELDSARN